MPGHADLMLQVSLSMSIILSQLLLRAIYLIPTPHSPLPVMAPVVPKMLSEELILRSHLPFH